MERFARWRTAQTRERGIRDITYLTERCGRQRRASCAHRRAAPARSLVEIELVSRRRSSPWPRAGDVGISLPNQRCAVVGRTPHLPNDIEAARRARKLRHDGNSPSGTDGTAQTCI